MLINKEYILNINYHNSYSLLFKKRIINRNKTIIIDTMIIKKIHILDILSQKNSRRNHITSLKIIQNRDAKILLSNIKINHNTLLKNKIK